MIIQGNSYRIGLRDESVHCCVTSFPYHGLRDYGLPPTIWGGDSRCAHVWGDLLPKTNNRNTRPSGDHPRDCKCDHCRADFRPTDSGQLCQLCGAFYGCFGLEPTIGLHVANAVAVCREIKRVLRRDGVFWLNYGDSYATGKNGRSAADTKAVGKDDRTFRDKPFSVTELPAKNLCGIPWRVALALQDDGWILRSEIPWLKANAMPSSVTDRPGTAHEHVFMLVKSSRYYYDTEAVRRGQSSNSHGGKFQKFVESDRKIDQLQVTKYSTLGGVAGDYNPAGRALRTSDPFFDSLDAAIAHLQDVRDNGGMLVDQEGLPAALVVNTESYAQAHYATFPRKLIAPLIKTTPEKVCPNCGAVWQRMVEKEAIIKSKPSNNLKLQSPGVFTRGGNQATYGQVGSVNTTTTGWQPTCKCIQKRAPNFGMKGSELLELADEVIKELAPVGGIILDPFCGSGTVGAVARELGRRFIGIDLSATYLAENALARSEKKTSAKLIGQLPMFREAAYPPRGREAL